MPVIGSDVAILGSSDYADSVDPDIVVVTAGLSREPGMSRDELLAAISNIIRASITQSLEYSPEALFIILTNSLDAVACLAMQVGDLPLERIIGQAGILDSARMRSFVAAELDVSVQNVHCYALGGHGDDMAPLTRRSNVAGAFLLIASFRQNGCKRPSGAPGRVEGKSCGFVENGQRFLYSFGSVGPDG